VPGLAVRFKIGCLYNWESSYSDYSFAPGRFFFYNRSMECVDLRGMSCPAPVVETKKFLESTGVNEIEVMVDNPVSCENVKRFLLSRGFVSEVIVEGEDIYRIRARLDVREEVPVAGLKKVLVYIDGETMGRGDEELGKILMRAFLKTLADLETSPWRVILINAGVKLAAKESEVIEMLREIEKSGVEILSCGTCLDFYGLKERIGVGRISNMFEILTSFNESTNVIRP